MLYFICNPTMNMYNHVHAMLFDYTGVRIDETLGLAHLMAAFAFLDDVMEGADGPITLHPEAGTCADIAAALALVREYTASPAECQRSFDAAFIRSLQTADYLGARFGTGDNAFRIPVGMLSNWFATQTVNDIRALLEQTVKDPMEAMLHAHGVPKNTTGPTILPSPESGLWRTNVRLPPVALCLLEHGVFTPLYDVRCAPAQTLEESCEGNTTASLLLALLTPAQRANAEELWDVHAESDTFNAALHTMLVVLRNERCALLAAAEKAKRTEQQAKWRVSEAEKDFNAIKTLISAPNNSDIRHYAAIRACRSRSAFSRRLVPVGPGVFPHETPTTFSANNQEVLDIEQERLKRRVDARVESYATCTALRIRAEEMPAALDEWLMHLVDAAKTETLKKTFFAMTTITFQLKLMAKVIITENHIPPSCQQKILDLFCEEHRRLASRLYLDAYSPASCDFPRGCRHSNGRPSPAKEIQMHDDHGRLVTLPSGEAVIWRAGPSAAQTQTATTTWNANVDILMHVRNDGVRGLRKVARCGYHGGGRDGQFPMDAKDERSAKRSRMVSL